LLLGANLGHIKMVSTPDGFLVNEPNITIHRNRGLQMSIKSIQLRMILIAFCLVLQNLSGKQAFPPESDESPRIKVTGMQ
jgi:hypothetical protein